MAKIRIRALLVTMLVLSACGPDYDARERTVAFARDRLGRGRGPVHFRSADAPPMPRSTNGENVCAGRTNQGEMLVYTVMVDHGHAGNSGWVYFEREDATGNDILTAMDSIGCPEQERMVRERRPGYWRVSSHLD